MKITKCPDHPTYKAIHRPRAICAICWNVYMTKHGRDALTDEDCEHIRTKVIPVEEERMKKDT